MHRRPSSQSQSRCCCSFLCSLPEFPLGRWKPCRQPSWDHSALPLSPSERSAEGRDKPGPVKLTEGHDPLLLGFAGAVWRLWAWSPLRDPSAIRGAGAAELRALMTVTNEPGPPSPWVFRLSRGCSLLGLLAQLSGSAAGGSGRLTPRICPLPNGEQPLAVRRCTALQDLPGCRGFRSGQCSSWRVPCSVCLPLLYTAHPHC